MQDSRGAHSSVGARKRRGAPSARSLAVSRRARLVELARGYIGYQARPGGLTDFGRRVGYNSSEIPWSGAFVDCVFRDAGIIIPSVVYAPSGLAEFVHSRRWRSRPRPGDIAFIAVQTGLFKMPSVGVVVNTDAWKKNSTCVVIEGGVNGEVVRKVYWKYELLGFGRPDFRPAKEPKMQTGPISVNPWRVRVGGRGRDVMNVQLALAKVVDLKNYSPGVFDAPTQRAFARWQRMIGYVGSDADGIPTDQSLEALSDRSKIFTVRRDFEN